MVFPVSDSRVEEGRQVTVRTSRQMANQYTWLTPNILCGKYQVHYFCATIFEIPFSFFFSFGYNSYWHLLTHPLRPVWHTDAGVCCHIKAEHVEREGTDGESNVQPVFGSGFLKKDLGRLPYSFRSYIDLTAIIHDYEYCAFTGSIIYFYMSWGADAVQRETSSKMRSGLQGVD